MSGTDRPRKVAVLGGGVGGMTAAFELTRPEHAGRFDVTVYQLGWRLGGKGASGRNADRGGRIEEHGLHIWFGFYANAFRMMRDVYKELAREEWAPLASVDKAFRACPTIAVYDHFGGKWHSHDTTFPVGESGQHPWELDDPGLPTLFTVAARALELAIGALPLEEPTLVAETDALADLEAARARARELAQRRHLALAETRSGLEWVIERSARARDRLEVAWAERLDVDMFARLFFTTLDAVVAAARGILDDGVLEDEDGFGKIDGREWTCWLKHHGASKMTIGKDPTARAPVLRSVYDVAFSFLHGHVGKPNAAAGTATSDLLKLLFTYPGEVAYKMTAGMGDAIFAPLYQVLCARGVKFRFFSAITELRPSGDGRYLEEVDVVPQVEGAEGYDPLVEVKSLPCWPSLPLWDQLPPEARKAGSRFETEPDPLGRGRHTTTLKRGSDFDEVVLGIPVGALSAICEPVMGVDRKLREMVERSATVATQAFQLWLRQPRDRLGFKHPGDSVAATFVEPLDTYCDMGHLIPREDWAEGEVQDIAYVCGVLDDRDETPVQATARVRLNALEYLRVHVRALWPETGDDPWSVLADPDEREGEARFEAQYWRANTAPWERYVITPAGNVASRMPSYGPACANLSLAGDWTDTGINGGCVEAAVMSGLDAAHSLGGGDTPIVGAGANWLTPK